MPLTPQLTPTLSFGQVLQADGVNRVWRAVMTLAVLSITTVFRRRHPQ